MVAASDSFTRADSTTTLGTTETGSLTWAVAAAIGVAAWGIDTGQAYAVNNITNHWATVDTSEADGTVEVTSNADSGGVIFRYTNGSNFLMVSMSLTGPGSPQTRLLKIVANVTTVLATVSSGAAGDVLSARFEGDQIQAFRNGVQIGPDVTESFNQTATKHGMFTFITTTRFGDWSFTPIEALWPLRVVDAGGPAYRIGPDYNPDGGLLRIVDPASGRAWRQGAGGGTVTEALYATSHAFGSSGTGADDVSGWSADASDAVTADDGVDLRWDTDNINPDFDFADVWADAIFPADLSVPSDAVFTTKQPAMAMTGTVSGTFVREVYDPDGSLLSTNTTGFFDATDLTADMIRAGGWFLRIYSEIESGSPYLIRASFQIDSAWIDLEYGGVARPLRYFDPILGVVATLPMILDT